MATKGVTLYRKEYAPQAFKLIRMGATQVDIAEFFGVSTGTVRKWAMTHPEMARALTRTDDEATVLVELSLFNRAIGYSYPDVDIRVVDGKIFKTEVMRHVPPDVTAAIFWLKNRKPERWRDKVDLNFSANPIIRSILDDALGTALSPTAAADITEAEFEPVKTPQAR